MDNKTICGLLLVLAMLSGAAAQEGKVEIVDSEFNCSDATLMVVFVNLNPFATQIDRVEIESCNITDNPPDSAKYGEKFSVNGRCDPSLRDKESLNVSVVYIEKTGEITGIVYKNTYVLETKCRNLSTKESKNAETPQGSKENDNSWLIGAAAILICLLILLIAAYLRRNERKKSK